MSDVRTKVGEQIINDILQQKEHPENIVGEFEQIATDAYNLASRVLKYSDALRNIMKIKPIFASYEDMASLLQYVRDTINCLKEMRGELETGRKRENIQKLVEIVLCTSMLQNKVGQVRTSHYTFTGDAKVTPSLPKKDTDDYSLLVQTLREEWPQAIVEKLNYEEVGEWLKTNYVEKGLDAPNGMKMYVQPSIKTRKNS